MNDAILQVSDLEKHYYTNNTLTDRLLLSDKGVIKAVDGISFNIERGGSFAIVGESGCGKSTAAETVLNLREPTAGEVIFDGNKISKDQPMSQFRKRSQIVFQDPYSSLNPRMTVGEIITEPLDIHNIGASDHQRKRAESLLEQVGLSASHYDRYPHEFSGGQRQRIAIARALSIEPDFIVLDEPVSALDVSVQAQILNLLKEVQDEYGITFLIISHNLSVVDYIADTVAVMYLGEFVEVGSTKRVFSNPKHPYTEALLDSVPRVDKHEKDREVKLLPGDVPSAQDPPSGCKFHTRCEYARECCKVDDPELYDLEKGAEGKSSCYRVKDDSKYWTDTELKR